MNNDLVSVIIPTYNRAGKVRIAIESVLRQTYAPIQLIVIDDGSEDNSREVISKYENIEYVFQQNAGQAAARNAGLRLAKGCFIASLDSDDSWESCFIEKCISKMKADELDFVFANWNQQHGKGEWKDFMSRDIFLQPYIKNAKNGWYDLDDEQLRALYLSTCPSPSSSGLIRRSSINGCWNEQVKIGDDWCLYLDMVLAKKCKASFTLEKLWTKNIDTKNIYDGRKWHEVLELLYIKDMEQFMTRYKKLLTTKELKVITRRYVRGMVELAKHNAFRDQDILSSLRLMKRSTMISPFFTFMAISGVFEKSIQYQLKEIIKKF